MPGVAECLLEVRVDARDAVDVHLLTGSGEDKNRACVVLAHGAGGNMHQAPLPHLQSLLAANGFDCARFNFPYAQRGRRAGRRGDHRKPGLRGTRRVSAAT